MDVSLNGDWAIFVDEKSQGIEQGWFNKKWVTQHLKGAEKLQIPGHYTQLHGLEKYVGVIWFCTELPTVPYFPKSHDYYFEIEGANYQTDVWLNGVHLGHNEGGFLPFRFLFSPDLISRYAPNYIAVRVDNTLQADGIPSDIFDWYNYGGIYRDVQIVVLDRCRIRTIEITTKLPDPIVKKVSKEVSFESATLNIEYTIKNFQEYLDRCLAEGEEPRIDYTISYLGQFKDGNPISDKILIQSGTRYIEPDRNLDESAKKHIPRNQKELESFFSDTVSEKETEDKSPKDLLNFIESTVDKGILPTLGNKGTKNLSEQPKLAPSVSFKDIFEVKIQTPVLWSPNTPDLYALEFKLHAVDEDKVERFGIRQIECHGNRIYLNKTPIFLKGVSLHEELIPYGRAFPHEERRRDVQNIKKYGFNTLRSAHYPHDIRLAPVCDEEGLFLLEEIPLYWNINFKKKHTLLLAARTLRDLLSRDFNRPSIIWWSIGNELPVEDISCRRAVITLLNWVKKLDSSRIVTYVSNRFFADTLRRHADINCLNCYFGWYYMTIYQLSFFLDAISFTNRNTPWVITEFGADAKYGLRDQRNRSSEDNQSRIVSYSIKIFNSKRYISGWIIWIYRDFRSPLRLNRYQNGFNRKGIVDEQNRPKLLARVMNQINNKKIPNIRHYFGSAYFFCLISRWFERILMAIFSKGTHLIRKRIDKQYSTTRL